MAGNIQRRPDGKWRPPRWKAPNDLLFTAPEGGVLRNTNFRPRFFDPAAEKAGLPGLTPHELRHTAASLAIAAGANVKAVQQILGHASAAMTLESTPDCSPMTSTPLRTSSTEPSRERMRTRCGLSRRLDRQNQAALPFEKPPEQAAG